MDSESLPEKSGTMKRQDGGATGYPEPERPPDTAPPPTNAPSSPSHLEAPPSDPEMVDPDDSTEFYKVVNEDLEMQQNARELVQEGQEERLRWEDSQRTLCYVQQR